MRLLLASIVFACSGCSHNAPSAAPVIKDEAAQRSFDAFDTNKDGQISHQEWVTLESRAAATIPEANRQEYDAALEAEFKKLDSNGDGSISFAEFQANNRPTACDGCTPITPGWVPLKPVH